MNLHLDRWAGLCAPRGRFGFATPFAGSPLGRVDRDFFERWAEAHHATLRAGAAAEGLVPDFDRLAWDGFDPRRVDPLIREFYEHTSRFAITVTAVDWNGAWHAAGRLFRAWADRAGNLRPPLEAGVGRREMQSRIGLLDVDGDGEADYRIWRRVFEEDGELLYVAAVHAFRAALDGGDRGYLTLTFPWPFFALTVVLACRNAEDDPSDFEMSTDARGASLAGTYAVVPGPAGRASFARLAGLHELFRFGARRRGAGPAVIEGTHSAHVGGARVFTLRYEIAPHRGGDTGGSGTRSPG